jgi:hypothetical protein
MNSVLVYTVHKAASMFIHKLVTELANHLEFDVYSINDKNFHDKIKSISWRTFIETTAGPSCFGPIRAGEDVAQPVFLDDISNYSIVLHVRDPRDVLTSAYYSHTYSHVITDRFKPTTEQRKQWEEQGVDDFVINRIPRVKKEYEELCTRLVGKDNVTLVKYENMVTDYGSWLRAFMSSFSEFEPREKPIIGNLLGKKTHEEVYTMIYKKYKGDFKPAKKEEDVYSHKRQVTPGDYKRKLMESTIDKLDDEFSLILSNLGY